MKNQHLIRGRKVVKTGGNDAAIMDGENKSNGANKRSGGGRSALSETKEEEEGKSNGTSCFITKTVKTRSGGSGGGAVANKKGEVNSSNAAAAEAAVSKKREESNSKSHHSNGRVVVSKAVANGKGVVPEVVNGRMHRKRGKQTPPKAASTKKLKTSAGSAKTVAPKEEPEPVVLSESISKGGDVDEEEEEEDAVLKAGGGGVDEEEVFISQQKIVEFKTQKRDPRDEVHCNLVRNTRIPSHVATRDYPHRYPKKIKSEANGRKRGETEEEPEIPVIGHYKQAEVNGKLYLLGDCVHVHSGLETNFIGRIIEFFEKEDKSEWFGVQWFFRTFDTAIGTEDRDHDKKRVFYSDVKDDNPLECIVGNVNVVRVPSLTRFDKGKRVIPPCDYYFDKGYKFAYATFYELPAELPGTGWWSNSEPTWSKSENSMAEGTMSGVSEMISVKQQSNACSNVEDKPELQLLDLYCGCGAMSTGLCLGANLAGANLVTRWAVDLNEYACISMKHNHPETKVRNEAAEDFLELLKEWKKLCEKYPSDDEAVDEAADEVEESDEDEVVEEGEYEVESLVGIRWVGQVSEKEKQVMEEVDDDEDLEEAPKKHKKAKGGFEPPTKKGLEFKVKWKGYSAEHDSWEPASNFEHCPERVRSFVMEGRKCKYLPLPGDVDVICGGPPCQGASGFNRFRNKAEPLKDPRNRQMPVFMDIVNFLRPRFLLMENVVDILKFCDGILGRYALARAVQMNYQVLPPFPLPTHSVIVRGGVPNLWERCLVAYVENQQPEWLQKPLVLKDAISDLPPVSNFQDKDDILYQDDPHTSFQRFVRLPKQGTGGLGALPLKKQKVMLPDHRPLCLNTDDYQRVCQIPKAKGANFRNLKGIIIKEDGTVDVEREPREYLASGKPLVPDYAVSFIRGKSLKPFGRLWWDETVSTVVTRAEPHNQIILHPGQDRVLTIRENARLQGFPDYYKLFGPIKQRYIQVGNAVAVPVATALGYSLGNAILKRHKVEEETIELPRHFPHSLTTPEGVPELPDNEEL
ncbi:hypothetical protein CY35_06G074300 [Sphagnum magellanicum]|nr:hypothetical protein CY35_06G074300 [Sphagnum magellanicum]